MAWRTRVLLVLAFAAVVLLASGTAAAVVGLSTGAETTPSLQALLRVEDDASSFVEVGEEAVAPYPQRRALYSSGSINYAALTASKAACYGPCPARRQAYSRGCQAIYQCRG